MNGLSKPPPSTVGVGSVLVGLVLVSAVVSNGTTNLMALSQCTGSRGGGVVTCDIIHWGVIGTGPPLGPPLNTNNPSGGLSFIFFLCASKSSQKDLP